MADIFEVPSYEEWVRSISDSLGRVGFKRTDEEYDHMQEDLPDHTFFRLDRSGIDGAFNEIAQVLTEAVAGASPNDKQLSAIKKLAAEIRKVEIPETAGITVVGEQGKGKSSLINALQHRLYLAKTSANGQACTAFPTRFCLMEDFGESANTVAVVLGLLSDSELRELISEQIRSYAQYHFRSSEDSEDDDNSALAADAAKKFLVTIYNARNNPKANAELDGLLNSTDTRNGALLEATFAKAQEHIDAADLDEDRTVQFPSSIDCKTLMASIGAFIAEEDPWPSLSPLVRMLDVKLLSLLTKHGVYITDLPGLNDIDSSRMATANEFRRKAGYEIHVTDSKRIVENVPVLRHLRESIKAHGAKRTILVITNIDDVFNDNEAIVHEIETQRQHPFPTIQAAIIANEAKVDLLKDMEGDAASEEINSRRKYYEDLKKMAQLAFMKQRSRDLEQTMRTMFTDIDSDPISVFSVAPVEYLHNMRASIVDVPILSPKESGIPDLRKHLLEICADANLTLYLDHAFDKLNDVLSQCRRIMEPEKADMSYARLCPMVTQHIARFSKAIENLFEELFQDDRISVWPSKLRKRNCQRDISKNIVEDWNTVHHSTYRSALGKAGIVFRTKCQKYMTAENPSGAFNWNEQIAERIEPDMDRWQQHMLNAAAECVNQLDDWIKQICGNILTSIEKSCPNKLLRDTAVLEWHRVQSRILKKAKSIEEIVQDAIGSTYQYATTETDIRCMIAKLNVPQYDKFNHLRSYKGFQNRFAAQKAAMRSEMGSEDSQRRTLVDRIQHAVIKHGKKTLREAFDEFHDDIVQEFQRFNQHMSDRAPPDIRLTNRGYQQRRKLRLTVPHLERMVAAVQNKFPRAIMPPPEMALVKREYNKEEADDDPEEYYPEPPRKRSKIKYEHNRNSFGFW